MKSLTFVPITVASLVMLTATADKALAQSTVGLRLFETKCASCHQSAQNQKAPDASRLRKMTPEAVYAALSKAPHAQIQGLSDDDKKTVAAHLGGRKIGVTEIADAKKMPNQCTSDPPMSDIAAGPAWNGWGVDPTTNARFQPASAAGLSAAQVSNLKLKWAFGLPLAEEAHSQPTIAGGGGFVGSDAGTVYSHDAASGCVYWSFQADGAMRVAPTVFAVKGTGSTRYAVYFGDQKANAYGLDAENGKLLWKVKVDGHPVAQITGAPTLYEGRLYVPTASAEERAAGLSMTYPCCTFRGSVTALDTSTGKQIWKTYIIPDRPKPTKKSGKGWAHDPDQQGKLLWKVQLVDKLALGMITFGGAADDQNAYFGLRSGGIAAVSLKTGEKKWFTPLPGQRPGGPFQGETAALTVIPGVVFSGGWDGILRAFSTENGHQIWEVNTAHDYKTVNSVKANGGSMASAGPRIVGGTLFVGSGYLFGAGGKPGNVLLAFTAQ